MKRKKALAVFKNMDDAEQFTIKRIILDTLIGHKTACRITIAPDLIKCANRKRNLRLQKDYKELVERYLDKGWPKPDWITFQKYETSRGRNFILTNGLERKHVPKSIAKEKSKYLLVCEKFLTTLTYMQKQELKIILNDGI